MFNNIGSFSTVYLTLTFILFFLVLFEKKLIALEDKIKEKRRNKKRGINNVKIK